MDKIQFATNVAETVALKFATGKRVESRFSEYEVYYSLTDGRAMYATPALDAKIAALSPAAGEPFTICKAEVKNGAQKRIEWRVARVEGEETESGRQQVSPAKGTPVAAAPVPAAAKPHSNAAPDASIVAPAPAPAPRSSMTQVMGGALIAAIDALAVAREYGKTKGFALDFNEEDVRTTAASIFIAFTRSTNGQMYAGGAQ